MGTQRSGWVRRWPFGGGAVAYSLLALSGFTTAPGPGNILAWHVWIVLAAGAAVSYLWVLIFNGPFSAAALYAVSMVFHTLRAADLAVGRVWTGAALNLVAVALVNIAWVIAMRRVRDRAIINGFVV